MHDLIHAPVATRRSLSSRKRPYEDTPIVGARHSRVVARNAHIHNGVGMPSPGSHPRPTTPVPHAHRLVDTTRQQQVSRRVPHDLGDGGLVGALETRRLLMRVVDEDLPIDACAISLRYAPLRRLSVRFSSVLGRLMVGALRGG